MLRDERDKSFYSGCPLVLAADNREPEIVCYLLAKGAEINQIDSMGMTALHVAGYNNSPNVLKVLLENDPKPDFLFEDKLKNRAMHDCLCMVSKGMEAITMMLAARAKLVSVETKSQCLGHALSRGNLEFKCKFILDHV